MAFRTVIINDRCKLEYSLNYLICRKLNEEKKVLLDEVKILMINSTQVSISTYLITKCIEKKIKIIFTDEAHNPSGEIVGYYNNYYSYRKIKEQLSISSETKDFLWKEIVKEKIINQANVLKKQNHLKEYQMLIDYSNDVQLGDVSNREGHSAKVYFNALFEKGFSRRNDDFINVVLNYGYSIILATINREIKSLGYLTELGIHHIGESNQFNLSCDLIEPIRPLVDNTAINFEINETNYKNIMIELLSKEVFYNNQTIKLDNAIHLYVEDLLIFLKTGNVDKIKFIKYEF
ncbi:cRISPR-associated endonuclease Cas1 [Firmicutes bacterium CAG:449]|nr:cRISPR-associated endonuclease Cas1 [Firmicutes bacterium CAG:449]